MLQAQTQGLIDYTQSIINIGEELIFIMDVSYVPAQTAPIVLAQASTPSAGKAIPKPDYILKVCQETENTFDPNSAVHGVDPVGWITTVLDNRDSRYFKDIQRYETALATAKITMLEDTKYGKLISKVAGNGQLYYMYEANPEYIGKDKAVFMVELEGKSYKIVIDLVVLEVVDHKSPICTSPKLIKVTKPATGSSGYEFNSVSVSFAALNKRDATLKAR